MANTGIVLTRSGTSIANVSNPVGTLPTSNGGTGLTSIGSPNQVLGVNAAGTALEYKTLVAGTNVTISYAPGQITINSSGSGGSGVSQIIAGTGISITPSGGTGAVTINATGSASLQLYAEHPVSPIAPSATGTNSIALLSGSSAQAQDSLAIGPQSVARIQGSIVESSGRFASSGDAQSGRYMLRTQTGSNIPTLMYVDGTGGSVLLTLPDDSTWTFRAVITGHRTDASDGHAGFRIEGVIYRVAGASSVAFQGQVTTEVIARNNTPWTVQAVADTANGSLNFMVTGESGKVIRWVALVETVEVTN